MSKIEEGELVLSHEPFNVIEQGREIMTIIGMQAQEQGLTTVMEVEPKFMRILIFMEVHYI